MDKLTDVVKVPQPKLNVNVKASAGAVKNKVVAAGAKATHAVGKSFNKAKEFLRGKTAISYVIIGLLFIILILIILYLTQNLLGWVYSNYTRKRVLLDGTKDAADLMVINQDPDDNKSVHLPRSDDEEGGIEFTYTFWMYVNDWVRETDQEQHIFHKGEEAGNVNFAPKVTLDPKQNVMYIRMNTFEQQYTKVAIENMPVKKWVCVCIVVKHKVMDVYVNGFLKSTYTFKSLPKQNYRNVYINRNKGFNGYLSNLTYYRYAVDYFAVQKILNNGPSNKLVADATTTFQQIPPYLSSHWWQ
jgi:hypothetical protein